MCPSRPHSKKPGRGFGGFILRVTRNIDSDSTGTTGQLKGVLFPGPPAWKGRLVLGRLRRTRLPKTMESGSDLNVSVDLDPDPS